MTATSEELFLRSSEPLSPADAVAALLVRCDGCYAMQLRDPVPNIFYPHHWGCFGGAIDEGESALEALRRELREELEFEVESATQFTRFDFDFTPLGHRQMYRVYYEVPVSDTAWGRLSLHEGSELRAFRGPDLLLEHKVVPYDAFALWMHLKWRALRQGSQVAP
jgi:8-oxo-dGTP pyrophosphatase MutT (NUDIX family)